MFLRPAIAPSKYQVVGGKIGTDKPEGHHTDIFDVDDRALSIGLELLARIVLDILGKK